MPGSFPGGSGLPDLRLRHQLPAYSPLAALTLAAAIARGVVARSRERQAAHAVVAAEFDAEGVVLTDSGRSALTLAIEAALAGAPASRRIVALPAFQCFEVAAAAVGAGCGVALYDVDPETLAPDLSSVEDALRTGAGAIVVAPLYGIPVDWDAIATLAQRFDAVAIEDAAQGGGAEFRGRKLGSLGVLSLVSFGRGKGWTGGGGGALCLRGRFADRQVRIERELSDMARGREARQVATTVVQWLAGRPALYGVPAGIPSLGLGETRYHPPTAPTRAGGFSAALLRRTLRHSREEALRRRENAERWIAELGATAVRPRVLSGGVPGYLRFPILVRDANAILSNREARRLGIAAGYPTPLSALPPIRERMANPTASFPGATRLATELVTLPTHSLVTSDDRARAGMIVSRDG